MIELVEPKNISAEVSTMLSILENLFNNAGTIEAGSLNENQ